MKKFKVLLVVLCMICIAPFTYGRVIAHADETSEATQSQTELASEEDKTIIEVIKEYLTPVIVGSGFSLTGLLILIIPLIKKDVAFKTVEGAYKAQTKVIKDLQDKLKQATEIDYAGLVRTQIDGGISSITSENNDNFKELQKDYADILMAIKTLHENTQTLISAATVAWQSKPAAVEKLATVATASALKKAVLLLEQFKDEIKRVKGDEAEKIIAELEAIVEEGA